MPCKLHSLQTVLKDDIAHFITVWNGVIPANQPKWYISTIAILCIYIFMTSANPISSSRWVSYSAIHHTGNHAVLCLGRPRLLQILQNGVEWFERRRFSLPHRSSYRRIEKWRCSGWCCYVSRSVVLLILADCSVFSLDWAWPPYEVAVPPIIAQPPCQNISLSTCSSIRLVFSLAVTTRSLVEP